MHFLKRRKEFLFFICGLIILIITAKKCQKMVGEKASSKTGKFTIWDCFDGSLGSLGCMAKESVKLYSNNIRAAHVELSRHKAVQTAVADALSEGMAAKDAARRAKKVGEKAAKRADRRADRVLGPIISSGWDFFEVMYYGGTMTEAVLRCGGTLLGTYAAGFLGEQRFQRFGYLVGGQFGSWIGGRIGLMVYDVVNGVHYLLQFSET